jgi:hypothetical protein
LQDKIGVVPLSPSRTVLVFLTSIYSLDFDIPSLIPTFQYRVVSPLIHAGIPKPYPPEQALLSLVLFEADDAIE